MTQDSRSSGLRTRVTIITAVIGLIAWALATADAPTHATGIALAAGPTPEAPQTLDFGAQPAGQSKLSAYGTWQDNESCPTEFTGFTTSGDQNDFPIYDNGCLDYQWGPGGHAYGTKCKFHVEFSPQAVGSREVTITPIQTGDCQNIGSIEYFGAGVTITPSLLFGLNNFALELPSPQNPTAPFSAGYSTITFDSGSAAVTWAPTLKYRTSGKIPNPPAQPSPTPTPFITGNNGSYTMIFGSPSPTPSPGASFPVAGGTLDIATTYSAAPPASNDPEPQTFEAWMTGILTGICDESITNELEALYANENAACTGSGQPWPCCSGINSGTCAPATPDLITLIAMDESSYAQFTTITANGFMGLWPKENPKNRFAPIKGLYIGLMQVALQAKQGNTYAGSMETAWNWLTNSQTGYDIFNQKIADIVKNIQDPALAKYPTLASLTPYQMENMALLEYSGTANTKTVAVQYYTVQCGGGTGSRCIGGNWKWQENLRYQGKITYVEKVRAETPPSTPCS